MIDIVNNRLLIAICAILFLIHKAHSADYIMCYNCTSVSDPKCGVTWGYGDDSPHKIKCYGRTAACKKIVSTDAPKSKEFVIRSCWNSTDGEKIPDNFLECKDVMKSGESCFCNKDFCNGQGHIVASGLAITIATVAGLFYKLL